MPPPSLRYTRSPLGISANRPHPLLNQNINHSPLVRQQHDPSPVVFTTDDVDPSDSLDELLLGPRPQRHPPIDELAPAGLDTELGERNVPTDISPPVDSLTPAELAMLGLAHPAREYRPEAWVEGIRSGRAVLPFPTLSSTRSINPPWREPLPASTAADDTILPQPIVPRVRHMARMGGIRGGGPGGSVRRSGRTTDPRINPSNLDSSITDDRDIANVVREREQALALLNEHDSDMSESEDDILRREIFPARDHVDVDEEEDEDDYEAQFSRSWERGDLRYVPASTRLRREAAEERRRAQYAMYRLDNDSQVDLGRGGNNRRRGRERDVLEEESGDGIRGGNRVDEWFLGSEWVRRVGRAPGPGGEVGTRTTGLSPTNSEEVGDGPLLVRTSGMRRQREEDALEGRLRTKRRKLDIGKDNKDDIKSLQPTLPAPTRPIYLSYTTLSPSTPFPTKFTPPTPKSNIVLTTLTSPSHPPRPITTFSPIPQEPSRNIIPPHPDSAASALRTREVIPVGCGVFYFEVTVLSKGEDGYMSIGVMEGGCDLGRLVGWDKGSWGWHGDDGRSFGGEAKGKVFGETWGDGDTVGYKCRADAASRFLLPIPHTLHILVRITILYLKHTGISLDPPPGHVFEGLSSGLYPAIGLRTPGESLSINFTGPFLYDIDTHVKRIRDETWSTASLGGDKGRGKVVRLISQALDGSTSVLKEPGDDNKKGDDTDEGVKHVEIAEHSVLRDGIEKSAAALVLDYLRHNGHNKTLEAMKDDMVKREWVPSTSASSSSTRVGAIPFEIQTGTEGNMDLSDFDSPESALIWLETALNITSIPLPRTLIDDLSSHRWGSTTIQADLRIERILRVENHIRLLRASREAEDDGYSESIAIRLGMRLLESSVLEKWDEGSKKELMRGFGLLAIDLGEWEGGGRRESRREFVREVVGVIRQQRRMKERSYLEQAVRQSLGVQKRLNEVDGMSGFVDVGRFLRGETTGAGEVKGEVGVKVEGE